MLGEWGLIPGKVPLEKEMAIHSSTPAWKIPWMEGLQRVGHDWATSLSFFRGVSWTQDPESWEVYPWEKSARRGSWMSPAHLERKVWEGGSGWGLGRLLDRGGGGSGEARKGARGEGQDGGEEAASGRGSERGGRQPWSGAAEVGEAQTGRHLLAFTPSPGCWPARARSSRGADCPEGKGDCVTLTSQRLSLCLSREVIQCCQIFTLV